MTNKPEEILSADIYEELLSLKLDEELYTALTALRDKIRNEICEKVPPL